MLKKIMLLGFCGFLAGCMSEFNSGILCPRVEIPRETAYLTQIVRYKDQFQVELTGYTGYCWFDKRVNRNKASLTPEFVVRRLRPSPDTSVDFSYYTETLQGPPEYLGRRTYFETVDIAAAETEKKFSGKTVELKVPDFEEYKFTIELGLVLSPEELKYNRRTFDVNYDYLEE